MPFIAEVMQSSGLAGGHYAAPYAGGAGVALQFLLGKVATRVYLNDLSKAVYSFWRAILTRTEEFCRRISTASLTVSEWRRQKDILARPRDHGQLDLAFSLFFLNRCNRSGIPSGGVIGGLQQAGPWKIDARFPRVELIRRVEAIPARKQAISVSNLDAGDFLAARERIPQQHVGLLRSAILP